MTRFLLGASLWLLLVPLAGAAQSQIVRPPDAASGTDLLRACGAEGYGSDFWFCQGYLAGFNQTVVALITVGAIRPPYCPPKGLTNRRLRNIVISYLRAYPAQLDQSAELLTLAALSTAFPCPN